jgi:hypothetical protein
LKLFLKKFVAVSSVLFLTLPSYAAENQIQKIWSNGKQFLIANHPDYSDGQEFRVVNESKKIVAFAKIKTCKKKQCLLTITKSTKHFQLKTTHQLELVANKIQRSEDLYLGYGGPLGGGIRLSYSRNFIKKNLDAELSYIRQGSDASNLKITGNILSLGFRYMFIEWKKLRLSALTEAGIMKLDLDFHRDSSGPNQSATTYYVLFGGDLAYVLTDSFSIVAKAYMSKNGLDEEYSNSSGENYTNPYSKPLLAGEIGLRYNF